MKINKFNKVLLIIMGLLLYSNLVVYADDYYKSPVDYGGDGYIKFGDSEHRRKDYNSISIDIDKSSVSPQWIDIHFAVDEPGLISDRDVDKFLILANGKIVEELYVQYETDDDGKVVPAYEYVVKPSSSEFIGSNVNFQIVAVEVDILMGNDNYFAAAWSDISDEYEFDPLPVRDDEAIEVLEAILSKLHDLLNKLRNIEGLLSKISQQIETMLTPSPQAMERFEKAQEQLWEKMPSKQASEQAETLSNMFNETKSNLDNPEDSELVFGEKRDWFGIGAEIYLFDLSAFAEQVKMLRELLSAVIWLEFMFFVLFYLAPKFDI